VSATRGRIINVSNHGTIITVTLATGGGELRDVHFDHRSFSHMLDAEVEDGGTILGHTITVQEGY
jgi:hypothetical protein